MEGVWANGGGLSAALAASVVVVLGATWWFRDQRDYLATTKAVLITGCDSGIGFESARLLDRLGFTVFAGCLFSDGEGAKSLRLSSSNRLTILQLDVRDPKQVERALQHVQEELRTLSLEGLWALINNAAVYVIGQLDWMTWEQCQLQIDVNLVGVIRITRTFLPLIIKAKGRIVNVSSFAGKVGVPFRSVYCATKHAIEGFSDSLRVELHKYGVQVAIIQPGNHCRLTRICSQQTQHAEAMWTAMTADDRTHYMKEFWRLQKDVKRVANRGPPSLVDTSLLEDIVHSVTQKVVRRRYPCGTWWEVKLFQLSSVLPMAIIDWMMRQYRSDF